MILGIRMKKALTLLLALFFLTTSCVIMAKPALSAAGEAEDTWSAKAPMQEARGRLGVAAVNGKIYAIGGGAGGIVGPILGPYRYGGTGLIRNTTEEYDPEIDKWAFKAPLPTPREHFGITVYENKIYCIGGDTKNGESGVNEVYDPATDMWETKTPMPVPTRFPTSNVVDGKIYLIGTRYSGHSLNQVYDPETCTWASKTPPPTQIGSGASAVFDNKIYSINIDGFVQIYDPANDSWAIGAKAPSTEAPGQIYPLDTATAAVTSGVYAPKRIYFFGEAGTYVYDPANDSWTVGEAMPTARGFAGAAVINDTIYVVGGVIFQYSGGYMESTAVNEQYTPIGYGTVPPTNPPWLVYVTAASASAIAVGAGLIVYFKKRRHKTSFAS
jgi:N-acetylneuraminic acid mutarotase